jgi:raffinose/stachyose/melibiose transport system permease protein
VATAEPAPPLPASGGRVRGRMKKFRDGIAYLFLLPLLIMMAVVVVYPLLYNLLLSFYQWDGFSKAVFKRWVGVRNYTELLKSEYFWIALRNTAYFELACCVFQVFFPLIFSVIIFYGYFKNEGLIKGTFYFPALISPVVVGLVWKFFFSLDGPINLLLRSIGLGFLAIEWLGNIYTPIWILSFINIWQWTGFGIVLYIAGLGSVDETLLEAARIDGAGLRQSIQRIVIPILRPIILLDLLLVFISGFRVFDLVYVVTRGGPIHQSEVLTTLQYFYSFDSYGPNKMGVASVVSVVLFVFIAIFSLFRFTLSRNAVPGEIGEGRG